MNLIRAWAQVKPAGWRCVLAGPDEAGHRAELEREINALGLKEQFEFPGSLEDGEKWERYRSSDLFVLPSFTENFGLVVAEALVCGVPVITTKGTPWSDLLANRCGWWVEAAVEPLAAALREATVLTDQERDEMGVRGRKLVRGNFSWSSVASRMRAVYSWCAGRDRMPSSVTKFQT
jgi:glycosyltransferase involved in cell wall biosynthesis